MATHEPARASTPTMPDPPMTTTAHHPVHRTAVPSTVLGRTPTLRQGPSVFTEDTAVQEDHPALGLWQRIGKHLNFYRVHLIFFTFMPLLSSIIFWASNGEYKISYVDALFNCVSASTVTGLATVNLSSLTPWQQTIIFIQMCLGSPITVSWFMVFIRRYYFTKKLAHVITLDAAKRLAQASPATEKNSKARTSWFKNLFARDRDTIGDESTNASSRRSSKAGMIHKLRTDMIRRVDDAPKLVNPSGWVTGKASVLTRPSPPPLETPSILQPTITAVPLEHSLVDPLASRPLVASDFTSAPRRPRRGSDPGKPSRPSTPTSAPMHRSETLAESTTPPISPKRFPRVPTVEFAPPPRRPARMNEPGIPEHAEGESEDTNVLSAEMRSIRSRRTSLAPAASINTHHTYQTYGTQHSHHARSLHRTKSLKHRGYGGFPMPLTLIGRLVNKLFPGVKHRLRRKMTIPVTTSLVPTPSVDPHAKQVPYLSFAAVVGRNSTFHLLTSEQLDEIGGIEYRALNSLLWIIGSYHIVVQVLGFVIIAPYMAMGRWKDALQPPMQLRPVDSTWFSAFQVVSSYTNTGMSLVDQSMLPFQNAWPVLFVMMFLILAGNTCFPIFLRFLIWILTKVFSKKQRLNETLHFLLDHPRRCFIYLFPSHQTWFLLTIVLVLSLIDFTFFLGLDFHNPALSYIPKGTLVIDGMLQALAVRAAGFGVVPLAALVPPVKVLFVVMMYISVFPVAMSVRSTNVYEEQTLGIFNPETEDEQSFQPHGPRMSVWGRYLGLHARRQLAFDMWWLALALFLICWIESEKLQTPANYEWFNIFTILFEIVSAYGTVGLSLGIPTQNYSLSGDFRTLSKLIVCLVMLRGRHRGLPIAIDRAILLPAEFGKIDEARHDDRHSIHTTGTTTAHGGQFYYSETMASHHPTPDMHSRLRHSRFVDDDVELYHVPAPQHDQQSSVSSDEPRDKQH